MKLHWKRHSTRQMMFIHRTLYISPLKSLPLLDKSFSSQSHDDDVGQERNQGRLPPQNPSSFPRLSLPMLLPNILDFSPEVQGRGQWTSVCRGIFPLGFPPSIHRATGFVSLPYMLPAMVPQLVHLGLSCNMPLQAGFKSKEIHVQEAQPRGRAEGLRDWVLKLDGSRFYPMFTIYLLSLGSQVSCSNDSFPIFHFQFVKLE